MEELDTSTNYLNVSLSKSKNTEKALPLSTHTNLPQWYNQNQGNF